MGIMASVPTSLLLALLRHKERSRAPPPLIICDTDPLTYTQCYPQP